DVREDTLHFFCVQRAAGDAGGALGSAMFVWHQLLEKPRDGRATDRQKGSFLGPRFASADIRGVLDRAGAKYQQATSESDLMQQVVDILSEGKIVGWFQ